MQTFLPYPDFERSAKCLDWRRLGNQIREAKQIFRSNYLYSIGEQGGWQNHPATRMWRGYEATLIRYINACVEEWNRRGYYSHSSMPISGNGRTPKWLGRKDFHLSHQSNLIRKYPEHYRPIFGPNVPDNLPYVWPV